LRRKEGSLPYLGRRNKCGKQEVRSIPSSLRRKEGSVPDLGREEQIWEEGSWIHPWFFEEEGGLCPRSRKGRTDLGRRKVGPSWFFEEEGSRRVPSQI
jgi:hypothetical protein